MGLTKEELQRYSRHILLDEFGETAQLKLKNSKVLVVGAGGLGCPCLLYLTAAGVGYLGIADDDVVSVSNLQRQILYNSDDVRLDKAETAKSHLFRKNPGIHIETHPRIEKGNVMKIISNYDLVIDGSDNFSTRYLLNDACVLAGKPYIYGALFKFEGQLSTFNYKGGPTYRCLYPDSPPAGEIPPCSEVGVLGVLPGIIGTWQASEAIKVLTGIGEPLSGKLLMINLLTNEQTIIKFKLNEANKELGEFEESDTDCSVNTSSSIEVEELNQWMESDSVDLIDVREGDEFERFNVGGINYPFSEIDTIDLNFDESKKIVLVCSTGNRSAQASRILSAKYPDLIFYNLSGGLETII